MCADAIFAAYSNDFTKFELVEHKLSNRPDLHAFLVLDRMFPAAQPVVAAAEHDMVYLGFDVEQLEGVDGAILRDLHRCGVTVNDGYLCILV